MYCKLCGKHLYETITFTNLFKWNYEMHRECEALYIEDRPIQVFPLADKMVHYEYLFERGYEQADHGYLFKKYMGNIFTKMINNETWSILILIDDILDANDLSLIFQLGTETVYLVSTFAEIEIP